MLAAVRSGGRRQSPDAPQQECEYCERNVSGNKHLYKHRNSKEVFVNSSAVEAERGHLAFSLSRKQKVVTWTLFATVGLLMTVSVAKAYMHQHVDWWSPIDVPTVSCNTQGWTGVFHDHDQPLPYPYYVQAWHQYYDYGCVDMFGARVSWTYYSSWDVDATFAYAAYSHPTNPGYITYAQGIYTHKVNGAWTWINRYSPLFSP